MKSIKFDYSNSLLAKSGDLKKISGQLVKIEKSVKTKTGAGSEFLGWTDLPDTVTKKDLDSIESLAAKIRKNGDAFVSIGIGGSYLGAKAVIEAIAGTFNILKLKPQIFFAGNNISGRYLTELLTILESKKQIYANVISKSGTTTEPAIAFRFIKNLLEKKYKKNSKNHIIATTDKSKGALRKMADSAGWQSFVIPEDVGGRFSVLTPVGLLPIAAAGIDIRKLIQGSRDMKKILDTNLKIENNIAMQYAAVRFLMYSKYNKNIELLVNYNPELHYISEWWKQLYGESEGKNGKALFPASCDFTTDLHSMGQWIQDGVRNIFETVLEIENANVNCPIPKENEDLDELNYIAGKQTDFVNSKAMQGTIEAHISGKVPNLKISMPQLNEYYIGQLLYFFERACALSGYLLNVNPFDQPGVEAYKKNMFRLLGKK
ncbi:MAG TPA: glucose-6-phosphate isomerase [bacterium]|nr:glucose-6-phosphate isomerase [bacterium]HPN29345.1 glucose-6-phosphate isomerase [bacterium]